MRAESVASVAGRRRVAVEREGFAVVLRAACEESVSALTRALDAVADSAPGVRRRRGVYAIRNLLELAPGVRAFARSSKALALVEPAPTAFSSRRRSGISPRKSFARRARCGSRKVTGP